MQYEDFCRHTIRLSSFLNLTNFQSHQYNDIMLGIQCLYFGVSILTLTMVVLKLKIYTLPWKETYTYFPSYCSPFLLLFSLLYTPQCLCNSTFCNLNSAKKINCILHYSLHKVAWNPNPVLAFYSYNQAFLELLSELVSKILKINKKCLLLLSLFYPFTVRYEI